MSSTDVLLSARGLRKQYGALMGIVRTHQVPQPFSGMTVFENVFTAATHGGGFRQAEAYERCIDAIELCGMTKRLVCMDSGRVIAEGDPQEVLSNATVVDAYLGGGR
eukprot:gene5074-5124_t